MISVLASILAATAPLADSTALSSSNASYDGNCLVLKGQVILDHGLGQMKAEEAILDKQEVGKEFPFSFIRLRKDVLLNLSQEASLSCDTADLDFNSLEGHLTSSHQLIYTGSLKRKKGPPTSFCLKSKLANLSFSKQEIDNQKPKYDIASILAQENACFEYDQKYTLHADTAIFDQLKQKLSAYSKDKKCTLTHDNNHINADKMDLDLMLSEISMSHPQGSLHSLISQDSTHFSSDSLLWNQRANTLFLKGHISLEDPSLGTVLSQDEIKLIQTDNEISSIHTQGKTTINYLNTHQLTCFGTIDLDQKRMQAHIISPLVNGSTPAELQLFYQEEQITAFADTGHIEYTLNHNTLLPLSLSLKGHVRLLSHDPNKPLLCGITDRLTYSPTTRTFILNADPGKKVIFINEADNIRLTAQEVHVTEDPVTKRQTVKGVGSVQLTLSADEEALMNQFFNLSK